VVGSAARGDEDGSGLLVSSSTFPLLTQEKNNVDTLWEIEDKKENAL
jgi:hypothetical protein